MRRNGKLPLPKPLTDMERILATVLRHALFENVVENYKKGIFYEGAKPGDLVICQTSGVHRAMLGYLVEDSGEEFSIRDLVDGSICRMVNERYIGVKLPEYLMGEMYTGKKRQIYVWSKRAFWPRYNKKNASHHRFDRFYFGGATVYDDFVRITVRPHAFDSDKSAPYDVDIPWDKKTRLKDIVDGLALRPFEKKEEV